MILVFLSIKQIKVAAKSYEIINEDNVMRLAYEIIDTSNSNFNLQNEINRLREKNDSFSLDMKDRANIKEDLEKKLENYRIINGTEEVSGSGVEIVVSGNIITEETIDLINGIRNTKPKAIGINGKRVIYRSFFLIKDKKLEFDNWVFDVPFTIQVVGDTKILDNSLNRSGGILDIIKQNSFEKVDFQVKIKENVTLPAYDGKIIFKEAKIVN